MSSPGQSGNHPTWKEPQQVAAAIPSKNNKKAIAEYPCSLVNNNFVLNALISALNSSSDSCATIGDTVDTEVVIASKIALIASGLQFLFAATKASYLRYPRSAQKLQQDYKKM